jgi:hypothetical protein
MARVVRALARIRNDHEPGQTFMTLPIPIPVIGAVPCDATGTVELLAKIRPARSLAGDGVARLTKGRQSLYTLEIAQRVLDELNGGRSLRAVCRDQGMPPLGTVLQWVRDDRQGFAARYRHARKIGNAGTGRPAAYTAGIAQRILDQFSRGRPLMDICEDPGMPSRVTVQLWVAQDREGFAARYQRARETGNVKAGGRTVYTAGLADQVLDELAEGRALADVCRDPGAPAMGTVRHWVSDDREGFAARYHWARHFGYRALADEILEIVDDARGDWILRRRKNGSTYLVLDREHIARCRLRAKALRWRLSNAMPRRRR